MKRTFLTLAIIALLSFSLCWAGVSPVENAYSLYYQGKAEKAIELMEAYVENNPDAGAYYFLGYAYYEMEQMDKAMDYFKKSFEIKNFYSPIENEK